MLKQQLYMAACVVLLVIATTLAILTYVSHNHTNSAMQFLSSQHVAIMLFLVFVSIGFGYAWAHSLQGALRKEQQESDKLLTIINELLNPDERLVLAVLVEHEGKVFQSVIARKESMTRVKAHRTVKSLEERGVVKTEREGKQVIVLLKRSLYERLV